MSSRFPLVLYLGAITLITAIFSGVLLTEAHAGGLHGWALVLLGIPTILCASQLAVALANWLVTLLVTPHRCRAWTFPEGFRRNPAPWP